MDEMIPSMSFRLAAAADLSRIVALLADDPLGRGRESPAEPLAASYWRAFETISGDPNNELVVTEVDGALVAVMQITFIPYLTHTGSWRALIEGVRVDSAMRGRRIGHAMILWAIDRAAARGCRIVQLTTDKSRTEALRFYESLGFTATHEGMKLHLPQRPETQ